jgi:hypothetical protein
MGLAAIVAAINSFDQLIAPKVSAWALRQAGAASEGESSGRFIASRGFQYLIGNLVNEEV